MSDVGFLYVLIAGTALLIFAAVSIIAYFKRPDAIVAPQPILGHITEVREDEHGIFVTGVLTDEGLATFPGDTILWQSLSLQINDDGKMETVALVRDEAKPCKGTNGNICVAEGCYGEACVKHD